MRVTVTGTQFFSQNTMTTINIDNNNATIDHVGETDDETATLFDRELKQKCEFDDHRNKSIFSLIIRSNNNHTIAVIVLSLFLFAVVGSFTRWERTPPLSSSSSSSSSLSSDRSTGITMSLLQSHTSQVNVNVNVNADCSKEGGPCYGNSHCCIGSGLSCVDTGGPMDPKYCYTDTKRGRGKIVVETQHLHFYLISS